MSRLVSKARARAIIEFGKGLAALCERYGLQIYASPDGNFIEVVDIKRRGEMPEGYEFDALFEGCDPIGIFKTRDDSEKIYQEIEIEDLLPEDGGPAQ